MAGNTVILTVAFGADEDAPRLSVRGRQAWTLDHLVEAGERGVTPLERPAPRWSDYVHALRKRGVVVETIPEPHGGVYSGQHGRYVLRSPLRVVERRCAP